MKTPVHWKGRPGFAITIVVGVMVLVLFIAFFIHALSRAEIRLTTGYVDHQIAFHLAESGVEQALFALNSDLASNAGLLEAVETETPTVLQFGRKVTEELEALVEAPALGDVFLWARYDPEPSNIPSIGDYRVGRLTVRSQGIYTNAQGYQARRQLKVVTKVTGVNLGIVAPDHGFFTRDPLPIEYHVGPLQLDARDFEVMGGHIYTENGLHAELTQYLIEKEFIPMEQLGFFDLGYDHLLSLLQHGGVNLTHSRLLEYKRNGITRKYYKVKAPTRMSGGLGTLERSPLGGLIDSLRWVLNAAQGQGWAPVEEDYVPQVRARPQGYDNRDINLFKAEDYKKAANLVVEPVSHASPDGDPNDNKYFKDVFFRGPLNTSNTIYRNVLPLYGYGDWRRVPMRFTEDPTRKMDVTNAIHLDGVTYVHGDVFLEGWYEGIGTLVVQGNVYMGGDFLSLPPAVTGYQSLANLVVLEDPAREPYGPNERFNKLTGRVIFKPHFDEDFDRQRNPLKTMRDLTPDLDTAIYAQNGMETDKTSIFNEFFNMAIEFNFASDLFDFSRIPNDLVIYGDNPSDILRGFSGRLGPALFLNPQFSSELLSWEEETPST